MSEENTERWERIKVTTLSKGNDFTLKGEDYQWLMEQAEKAEQYEKALLDIKANVWDLSNQNAVIAAKALEKFNS